MTLTPEDLDNKRFSAVRLKEGYAMEEVDEFLDEVSVELRKQLSRAEAGSEALSRLENLQAENDSLREQLVAPVDNSEELDALRAELNETRARLEDAQIQLAHASAGNDLAPQLESLTHENTSLRAAVAHYEEAARAAAAAGEVDEFALPVVTTTAEASDAARRLLEISVETGERVMGEAKAEAEATRAEAASESETVVAAAHAESASLLESAHAQKAELDTVISDLRSFEAHYRSSISDYFAGQLEAVRAVDLVAEAEEKSGVTLEAPEEDAAEEVSPEYVAEDEAVYQAPEEGAEGVVMVDEAWALTDAVADADSTDVAEEQPVDHVTDGDGVEVPAEEESDLHGLASDVPVDEVPAESTEDEQNRY